MILLCRNRKAGNVYLPGGHIDFGETGAEALVREIREEMGCRARVSGFLGCAEHFFMQEGEPHAEINLVYAMRVSGITPDQTPPCCEAWIQFFWHPPSRLATSHLEPATLRRQLPRWIAAAPAGNLATTRNRIPL
jgi:8-oxo-dGTP diphosphatase